MKCRSLVATFSKASLLIIVCASFHGCAIDIHRGTLVTEQQANSFTIGTATPDDVIKVLGAPSWSATRPNGERVVGYMQSTSRINPPTLGTLTGNASRSEFVGIESTMFVFDTNLRLIRVDRPQANATSTTTK